MHGECLLNKLIRDYSFTTVLDVGCGPGEQTDVFRKNGKVVTPIDRKLTRPDFMHGDYLRTFFQKQDCIWCCHVLEHQLDPHGFLKKIIQDTKENGLIAITVPPLKNEIVGGHFTLWNAGLLVYHLVMAGVHCRQVQILSYGYDVSVLVRNRPFQKPDNILYDCGDMEILKEYLPPILSHGTNGQIEEYNWEGVLC